MPHIRTGNEYPGILGLLYFKESTGKALSTLAQALLHGPSGLSKGERELIAAFVSRLNECRFCSDSHAAAAACHLDDRVLVEEVLGDPANANISPKMRALLDIARLVRMGGLAVTPTSLALARRAGATDEDIHDTVLIAAAFCMYNRYVDGLGTPVAKEADYVDMGKQLAQRGYSYPARPIRWLVRKLLDRKFLKPTSRVAPSQLGAG